MRLLLIVMSMVLSSWVIAQHAFDKKQASPELKHMGLLRLKADYAHFHFTRVEGGEGSLLKRMESLSFEDGDAWIEVYRNGAKLLIVYLRVHDVPGDEGYIVGVYNILGDSVWETCLITEMKSEYFEDTGKHGSYIYCFPPGERDNLYSKSQVHIIDDGTKKMGSS